MSEENEKGEKNKKGYWENKINPIVAKIGNFEASDYYHIIYKY